MWTQRSPSRRGRRAFAWAVLGPALAAAQPGAAPPLSLSWSDPSGLAPLTAEEVDARLSERLGRPAFGPNGAQRSLAVNWLGTPEQCQVELRLLRGSQVEGTRRIESPSGDCRSLAPALLAVAALLIESADEAEPATAPAVEPPPALPAPAPPPPTPAPSRSEPVALLSAGAHFSAGFAPEPELGPSLALVLTPAGMLRVGLRAAVFLPQEHGVEPGMELSHAHATVLGCFMPLRGGLAAGLCGSAGLHRFRSLGSSLPYRKDTRTYAPMLGLNARAEWHIAGRLWWVADAGVDMAPSALYFHFTPAGGGETIVFRQKRVAPMLSLGITLELP